MTLVLVLIIGALLSYAVTDLLRSRNDRRALLVLGAAVLACVATVLMEKSGAGLIIVDGVLLGLVVSMTTIWWERRKRRRLRGDAGPSGGPSMLGRWHRRP